MDDYMKFTSANLLLLLLQSAEQVRPLGMLFLLVPLWSVQVTKPIHYSIRYCATAKVVTARARVHQCVCVSSSELHVLGHKEWTGSSLGARGSSDALERTISAANHDEEKIQETSSKHEKMHKYHLMGQRDMFTEY